MNGNSPTKLRWVLLNIRPNVFTVVTLDRRVHLPDAARGLAFGAGGTGHFRADGAGALVLGRRDLHAMEVEEHWRAEMDVRTGSGR